MEAFHVSFKSEIHCHWRTMAHQTEARVRNVLCALKHIHTTAATTTNGGQIISVTHYMSAVPQSNSDRLTLLCTSWKITLLKKDSFFQLHFKLSPVSKHWWRHYPLGVCFLSVLLLLILFIHNHHATQTRNKSWDTSTYTIHISYSICRLHVTSRHILDRYRLRLTDSVFSQQKFKLEGQIPIPNSQSLWNYMFFLPKV